MEHLQQHFGVAKPIKCQEQHCSLDWGKYWRDQVRNTPRLFPHTSQVSEGLLPPYLARASLGGWEEEGREGSVLKVMLLGQGPSGLWGIC